MTPMLEQYFRLKSEAPGCILFFRCGDFYETYGEDAQTTARELEIVETSKDSGNGTKIPMAGVPYFAVDSYIYALINKGYKVALADQMEDPKKAKGLVKREIIKILTAGTITDPQALDSGKNNYLCSIYAKNGVYATAFCDIMTGDFFASETDFDGIKDELERLSPSEVLVDPIFKGNNSLIEHMKSLEIQYSFVENKHSFKECQEIITNNYPKEKIIDFEILSSEACTITCAVILSYLIETQKNNMLIVKKPRLYVKGEYAVIDGVSKKNLELLETMSGREKRGTLLWAIDEAETAMGKRMLRNWIIRPLIKKNQIEARLDAVEYLKNSYETTEKIKEILKKIQDIERLISKVVIGSANPRDMIALANSLILIPLISSLLCETDCKLLKYLSKMADESELGNLILNQIDENPPLSVREGGIFRNGIYSDLDELRTIKTEGKTFITSLEEREKAKTGIKNLRIGFNQVFGYYIEISKGQIKNNNIPSDYIRKQTTVNSERYISNELKEYEAKVLGAEERIKSIEYEMFKNLINETIKKAQNIQNIAVNLAKIDVLCGFASISNKYGYSRPEISDSSILNIKNGRHPVVERITSSGFVKNDTYLDLKDRMSIITGPNMSGKSTYLRQAALITIMAQMGCFVPADSAIIGIADKFFTRVGATDDLHLGQSTFMVEMTETANILNNATSKSLVILDEIGRGTSTYDGISIAYAVCRHLYSNIKARTLFATHFYELTSLADIFSGISNRRVSVKELDDEVIFLHRILDGASDKSYGIYVASLAGFPEEVLEMAKKILSELEKDKSKINNNLSQSIKSGKTKTSQTDNKIQMTFFGGVQSNPKHDEIISELAKINLSEITPLEALNQIAKWQSKIKK